jgi:hypothetical protein
MIKDERFAMRLTSDQVEHLLQLTKEKGFDTCAEFVRYKVFESVPQKAPSDEDEFHMQRCERRSVSMSREEWDEIVRYTDNKISVSFFIKEAIREKIARAKNINLTRL